MTIHSLRRTYMFGSLTREQLLSCPIQQFLAWFEELKKQEIPDWFEINAMTLATANKAGVVSSRIVLLKDVNSAGFAFFTNYKSDKSQQLAENPHASLTFFWPMMERQIRVEGRVTKADAATSDSYFQSRPFASRLGAWVSAQSSPIPDDHVLEDKVEELKSQYPDEAVPRPEFWGGYRVHPTRIEFWQGKPSRLHDRFCYVREGESWKIDRLAP